jgi:hypothetical protein
VPPSPRPRRSRSTIQGAVVPPCASRGPSVGRCVAGGQLSAWCAGLPGDARTACSPTAAAAAAAAAAGEAGAPGGRQTQCDMGREWL